VSDVILMFYFCEIIVVQRAPGLICVPVLDTVYMS